MVTDEVETRRKVISQVFKNRYNKKNKESQDLDKFEEDGEDDIEESDA